MYSCPACGKEGVAGRATCSCGADLTLLECLDAVPDAWFNRAVEALSAGRRGAALEWLAACCAARPTDAAAQRALAKVWAQLGHPAEARAALDRAAEIEPDAPELAELRQALEEVGAKRPRKPAPAKPRRAKRRKTAGRPRGKKRRKR